MFVLILFAFMMQIYFIIEMKRIRIYVESKTPIELQIKLSKFRFHKIVTAFLLLLMCCSVTVSGIIIKEENPRPDLNIKMTSKTFTLIIISASLFIVTFSYLVFLSFQQYHFFILKKKEDTKLLGQSFTSFKHFCVYWIYTALSLNVISLIFSLVYMILLIIEYSKKRDEYQQTEAIQITIISMLLTHKCAEFMYTAIIVMIQYQLGKRIVRGKKRSAVLVKRQRKKKTALAALISSSDSSAGSS